MVKKKSKKVSTDTTQTRKRAGKIVEESRGIRQQVRDLTLEVINQRNLTINQLSSLAGDILGGATDAFEDALPASRRAGIREVVNGLSDAWAITAHASAASVKHAKQYGLKFAQNDLKTLVKRLDTLEGEFFETIEDFAKGLSHDLAKEVRTVVSSARKAGTEIAPSAESAAKAILEQGTQIVGEVATLGMRASQVALGTALGAVSGVFDGLSKAAKRATSKKR